MRSYVNLHLTPNPLPSQERGSRASRSAVETAPEGMPPRNRPTLVGERAPDADISDVQVARNLLHRDWNDRQ